MMITSVRPILCLASSSRVTARQLLVQTLTSSTNTFSKKKVLDKSLTFVLTHGWSQQAIIEGLRSEGYAVTAAAMFKRGGGDLALHFYQSANQELFNSLQRLIDEQEKSEQKKLKTGEFVRTALKTRLSLTSGYADSWHQAMALMAMPSAAPDALSCLYELVDEVWSLAGDKSHDMNWYSKRLSLAAVYKATELFMLQDKSEGFEETWQFMDRRLRDVASIGSAVTSLGEVCNIPAYVSSLTTVLQNVAGINSRSR